MKTECTAEQLEFHSLGRRTVVGKFDGGRISSDGGGVLLREVEQRLHILKRFSDCFTDYRNPELIEHTVESLIKQRVFGIALGYEDLNDHDALRHDELLALLSDKEDLTGNDRVREQDKGKALAGKSTLNRLELTPLNASGKSRYKKIVASIGIDEQSACQLYEDLYCSRGDMENRIKEQQLSLFADRTSTSEMRANQLRLYFSSIAYVLVQTLRQLGLKDTPLAKAQCDTIRLKLFKVGARIRVSVRKVWISFSESYPYADLFQQIFIKLQQIPLRC